MNEPDAVKILLVDDHPMVRERLAEVINAEPDLDVCGEAEDRGGALELIARTGPHLVILDLTLKRSHGLELIKDIQAMHPGLPMLVVSMQDESLYAERSIRAGANGYITKQEATRKILDAIRCVLRGEVYLSETMASQFASRMLGRSRQASSHSVETLADRELQVFELIGTGLGTRQIAERLHLDVKTIETYRSRIKDKLGIKDASELLQKAIAWMRDAVDRR